MQAFRDNWETQLRRGIVEFAVLAALRDTERYGYDLVRTLSRRPGLVVTEGTVYPLLNRLKREGIITSELRASSEGPARKYYRLTSAGRETLAWMHERWSELVDAFDQILEDSDA